MLRVKTVHVNSFMLIKLLNFGFAFSDNFSQFYVFQFLYILCFSFQKLCKCIKCVSFDKTFI